MIFDINSSCVIRSQYKITCRVYPDFQIVSNQMPGACSSIPKLTAVIILDKCQKTLGFELHFSNVAD